MEVEKLPEKGAEDMAISEEEKFRQMLEEPVNRLIPKLAVPGSLTVK